MNAFLAAFGDLEIEERRPRSWNEPKIKRLAFAKNRRHVLDDKDVNRNRNRNRNGHDAGDWALVPQSSQQRRANQSNQIQDWDRQRFDAKLRFDEEDERHQARVYHKQLQFMEEQYRKKFLQGEQLRNFMMQGQHFPRPPMGQFPQQGMQHHGQGMQHHGQGMQHHGQDMQHHGQGMQHHGQGMQQHRPPPQQIPIPPQHDGRGGHGGGDRIQNLGPPRGHGGQHGGQQHDHSDDDSDEESDESGVKIRLGGGVNGNRSLRHGYPLRRGSNGNRGHNGRGGRGDGRGRSRGRSDDSDSGDVIVVIESESESDDDRRRLSPRRIVGGHGQRLPSVYRRRSHSRGAKHHSRHPSRRRPSRIRMRPLFSDDSDSDDSHGTHVPFARRPSTSRVPLRRARSSSRGRHFGYDSDDSFAELNRRPRLRRLRSKSRGPRMSYYIR